VNSRSIKNSQPRSAVELEHADKSFLVGLAGQPNVGKSTIFNLLTGLSQHVGNWPGKTVARKEGLYIRSGVSMRIVDLPGAYSLTANSDEERISRDFILQNHPDVIVMVADASALERNLYLLAELLMLPVPVVLGLNMMDVAETQGIHVEAHVLEAALGLPVIPLVAIRNQGVAELIEVAERLARDPVGFQPVRPEIGAPHRDVLTRVRALLDGHIPAPYPSDWVALKLLEGDAEITERARRSLPHTIWRRIETLLGEHEDAILDVAGGRYEWIDRMVHAAVRHPRLGQISLTDRLDRFAVHPFWGLLILLGVFGLLFWLTFALAAPVQEWLDVAVIGRLQMRLADALVLAGAPSHVVNLLVDGVLGGVGIVLTFLPILTIFFTVLAFFEDSGYLTRAAYMMDRFMHLVGLHGKSFLPLFLGFGCNVPAVMGARVIESRAGRLLTILLAPLVPCSARLVVLAFLAPVFFGKVALPVSLGFVALNILVLVVVGVILNHTLFRGRHTAFIMELPLYHLPDARTIGLFVWHNIRAFLRKAGSIILLMSVLIWTLSHFPGDGIEQSYLARFGRSLTPLGHLMGMDWRLLVALLSSFIAKENAIATLGILYGTNSESEGLAETLATQISAATALFFLAVIMLFVPCVATVAVMYQETGSWRWILFSVILLLTIALSAGVLVYQGAYWLGIGILLDA